MDVLAGTPVTLWVDFVSATDDLVVPDAASVSFSLYAGTGVRILGPVALTPAAEATGVSVAITDANNAISPERLFDNRTVVVSWMADGRSGRARAQYRVVPFPLYSVDENKIRDVIGIASDELPNEAIDIFSGYLFAANKLGAAGRTALDAALTSGSTEALIANRFVAYATIEQMLPSLAQRILQAKTDGTLKSERVKGLDLEAFGAKILTQLALDANNILDVTLDQLATPPLMVLTSPTTDPVTGNAPDTGT